MQWHGIHLYLPQQGLEMRFSGLSGTDCLFKKVSHSARTSGPLLMLHASVYGHCGTERMWYCTVSFLKRFSCCALSKDVTLFEVIFTSLCFVPTCTQMDPVLNTITRCWPHANDTSEVHILKRNPDFTVTTWVFVNTWLSCIWTCLLHFVCALC